MVIVDNSKDHHLAFTTGRGNANANTHDNIVVSAKLTKVLTGDRDQDYIIEFDTIRGSNKGRPKTRNQTGTRMGTQSKRSFKPKIWSMEGKRDVRKELVVLR